MTFFVKNGEAIFWSHLGPKFEGRMFQKGECYTDDKIAYFCLFS